MFRFVGWLLGILLLLYSAICLFFFVYQEEFLFYPEKLPADFRFNYHFEFEEYFIEVEKGVKLNGLLFKARGQKRQNESRAPAQKGGLVFYLHGNSGSLSSWGYSAREFIQQGYDVFIPDYRGFGKSEGTIGSQEELFSDMEKVFLEIRNLFPEEKIIITGFSIGTGPATWLASRHQPDKLVLIAPFYNMGWLAGQTFPFLPSFILRYPFNNDEYLQQVNSPIVLIHGTKDAVIPYEATLKLKVHLKPDDRLFSLNGVGHNNISGNPEFKGIIKKVLND